MKENVKVGADLFAPKKKKEQWVGGWVLDIPKCGSVMVCHSLKHLNFVSNLQKI